MKSKRQIVKARKKRSKRNAWLGLGAGGVILIAGLIFFLQSSASPAVADQSVTVMADSSHVAEGTDSGPYNSDPPTSGKHYEATLEAGFYEEGEVDVPYPAGHLVHNLEHGYVIFWYNCSLLDEGGCSRLKGQIQDVLEGENNYKVIAFPWESIDVPVVMTSWGRRLDFDTFDPQQARSFVARNRNKSPEPNAP